MLFLLQTPPGKHNGVDGKLTRLYSKYYRALFGYVLHQLDNNQQEAEDVIHNLFFALRNNLDNLDEGNEQAVKNYLYVSIRHEVARAQKSMQKNMAGSCDTLPEQPIPDALSPPDVVEQRELVRQALLSLDVAERELFVFKHWYGFQNTELADMFNISPSNVSVRLVRIKDKLHKFAQGWR